MNKILKPRKLKKLGSEKNFNNLNRKMNALKI